MIATTALCIADNSGTPWLVTVDGSGVIQQPIVAPPGSYSFTFALKDANGVAWILGIDGNGNLVTNRIATQYTFVYILMAAPDGTGLFAMYVDINGVPQTTPQAEVDPVPGTIFNPHKFIPPFTQPDGPNTPTYPQQQSGAELVPYQGVPFEIGNAMFTSGCGHWFNSWEVRSATVNGITAALMCCPLCGYLQRIIVPYNFIHDYSNFILFA